MSEIKSIILTDLEKIEELLDDDHIIEDVYADDFSWDNLIHINNKLNRIFYPYNKEVEENETIYHHLITNLLLHKKDHVTVNLIPYYVKDSISDQPIYGYTIFPFKTSRRIRRKFEVLIMVNSQTNRTFQSVFLTLFHELNHIFMFSYSQLVRKKVREKITEWKQEKIKELIKNKNIQNEQVVKFERQFKIKENTLWLILEELVGDELLNYLNSAIVEEKEIDILKLDKNYFLNEVIVNLYFKIYLKLVFESSNVKN